MNSKLESLGIYNMFFSRTRGNVSLARTVLGTPPMWQTSMTLYLPGTPLLLVWYLNTALPSKYVKCPFSPSEFFSGFPTTHSLSFPWTSWSPYPNLCAVSLQFWSCSTIVFALLPLIQFRIWGCGWGTQECFVQIRHEHALWRCRGIDSGW